MDLKEVLSKAAPLLGLAVGGPGGAVIANEVAKLFEAKPGDAADLLNKITTDPEAVAKLQEFQLKHEAIISQNIIAINQTMQAESKSERWPQYTWRPFWGFISAIAFLVYVILVCLLAYKAIIAGKMEMLNVIPQLTMAMVPLFGIPGAILGVASWHRGKQKRELTGLTK